MSSIGSLEGFGQRSKRRIDSGARRLMCAMMAGPVLCALTGVVVAASGGGAGAWSGDHPLVVLLRFMAIVKAGATLGAAALLIWRLRTPVPSPIATGYTVGLSLMAFAPGLIWSLDHVASGAVLFHLGLLTAAAIALGDDGDALRRRP